MRHTIKIVSFKIVPFAIFLIVSGAVSAQDETTVEEAAADTAAEETAQPVAEEETAQPAAEEAAEPIADSELSRILQGMQWGASHEEVLAHYDAEYQDDFRADVAGLRDPLRIDEIRRLHGRRFDRIVESYDEFTGTRTGYEVSVLGTEAAPGNDESMLTVRTDNAQIYYIFASDQLFKLVVAYNANYVGVLSFEAFLDQVERRYGPPESTEVDETVSGIRFLARALWQDHITRLRVENRSNLFGTFIMVFTDPELEERTMRLRGVIDESSTSNVEVSDLIRSISGDSGRRTRSDIADDIIGAPTTVELTIPEAVDADVPTPEEQQEEAAAEAALAEEQALAIEEEEEAARRARRRRRERAAEEAAEAEEEESITVY